MGGARLPGQRPGLIAAQGNALGRPPNTSSGALKARLNPPFLPAEANETGSIPKVILIKVHVVLSEQITIFFLEGLGLMMTLLAVDVPNKKDRFEALTGPSL